MAEVAAPMDSAESLAWREEIRRALGRLRVDQREAFLLRHVEGLSYEEMAALTGVRRIGTPDAGQARRAIV